MAQTSDSSEFCIPFYDNGQFKLKIFKLEYRMHESVYVQEIKREEGINQYLGIIKKQSTLSASIDSFQNSCIHAKYMSKYKTLKDRVLFVNLFDINKLQNVNFRYHIGKSEANRFTDKHVYTLQNCSPRNWPMNLHHDEKFDIYYIIYREGQCLTLNSSNERLKKDLMEQTQKIKQNILLKQNTAKSGGGGKAPRNSIFRSGTAKKRDGYENLSAEVQIDDNDEQLDENQTEDCEEALETFCRQGVGYSILFKNVALITRHSGEILFYKRDRIDEYGVGNSQSTLEKYKWKEYHALQLEAQISHTKNQDFFIVCTLEKIFQYTIDKETLEPIQLGIMYNNMDCRKVISSPKQQAYISFNMNQPDFRIYNRKYQHCFKAEIEDFHQLHHGIDHELEDCDHLLMSAKLLALNLEGSKSFLVADSNAVKFYDGEQFTPLSYKIQLDLDKYNKMNKRFKQIEYLQAQILSIKVSGTKKVQISGAGFGFGGFKVVNLEKYIAIQVGMEYSRLKKAVMAIFLYELDYTFNHEKDSFEVTGSQLLHTYNLPKELEKISKEFHFINGGGSQTEIMMIDEQCIYLYDFQVKKLNIILDFNQEFGFKMSESPHLFVLNQEQTVAFVSNSTDTLIIDIVNNEDDEIGQKSPRDKIFEVDNIFLISNVKQCISADSKFFIVANQRGEEKGLFLFSIDDNPFEIKKQKSCKDDDFIHSFKNHQEQGHDSQHPLDQERFKFLISDPHLYNIGDVDIYITIGKKRNLQKAATDVLAQEYKEMQQTLIHNRVKRKFSSMFETQSTQTAEVKKDNAIMDFKEKFQGNLLNEMIEWTENKSGQSKELIISFKTQHRNHYNFIVIDIENNPNRFVFNHEMFHVYEQYITGILLFSNDFLTITQEKLCVVSVSRSEKARELVSPDQFTKRKFHSLQECSYLQLHQNNHITLRYPDNDLNNQNIEVLIQDQFQNGEKTEYYDLFKIQIMEMSFWELLLLRNLYYCNSTEKMVNMIQEQPNSRIFFKSFLELDMSNLASLLSFDNRIVQVLLSEENINEMKHEYPVIYKIKRKNDEEAMTYTAIDVALKNNQLQAVNTMVSYIVRYQNSPIFSYIFEKNFTDMIVSGVFLKDLLNSKIFWYQLTFDDTDWPQEDFNHDNLIIPYSDNMFALRNNYKSVVGKHLRKAKSFNPEVDKLHKVQYHLNLLPQMGEFINLMDDLGQDGDIELFSCEAVKNLAKWKWEREESNAQNIHRLSSCVFLVYLITYFIYINIKYNSHRWQDDPENYNIFTLIMFLCNTYAFFYEFKQALNTGWFYLIDTYNYNDMIFISSGYINIFIQYDPIGWNIGTNDFTGKLFNIIFVVSMLAKSFFFFRMIENFTKIVIMIINVIGDLKFFIIFYMFILLMLSQILGILGIGNINMMPNAGQRDIFLERKQDPDNINRFPGDEYKDMPVVIRNFLIIMRFSLGDFDFDAVGYLGPFEQNVFYFTWVLITFMTCIIILNFVIAEVNQSYERVNSNVNEQILREKVQLIAESEDMMGTFTKYNQDLYPRYLVVRKVVNI